MLFLHSIAKYATAYCYASVDSAITARLSEMMSISDIFIRRKVAMTEAPHPLFLCILWLCRQHSNSAILLNELLKYLPLCRLLPEDLIVVRAKSFSPSERTHVDGLMHWLWRDKAVLQEIGPVGPDRLELFLEGRI
jgi:hypothetical protein